MFHPLSTKQRLALKALVGMFVPSLHHAHDPHRFWATSGVDIGVVERVEHQLAHSLQQPISRGLVKLIDILAALQFAAQPTWMQVATVRAIAVLGAEAAAGMQLLHGLCVMSAYGSMVEGHTHPFWQHFGYPNDGTTSHSPITTITPYVPRFDNVTLDADVVVVGSGAGGGVLAGALASQGRQVVVLEAGGYFNEADFNQQEQWAR